MYYIRMEDIKKIIHRENPNNQIDLHLHSYYSDGQFSPTEIVNRAFNEGKKIISLTDHDGVNGNTEAKRAAEKKGIIFIDGIEISAHHPFNGAFIGVHILGYGIDSNNSALLETAKKFEEFRKKRNKELFAVLNSEGYEIKEEDVIYRKGQSYIGKVLIGRALVKKGYIEKKEEAFEKGGVFDNPKIRKIKKKKIYAEEAIKLIHQSGGIAVIAHPGRIRNIGQIGSIEYEKNIEEFIVQLKTLGIDGIEAWYKHFSKEEQRFFKNMGKKHNLILTTGSDFHGDNLEPD